MAKHYLIGPPVDATSVTSSLRRSIANPIVPLTSNPSKISQSHNTTHHSSGSARHMPLVRSKSHPHSFLASSPSTSSSCSSNSSINFNKPKISIGDSNRLPQPPPQTFLTQTHHNRLSHPHGSLIGPQTEAYGWTSPRRTPSIGMGKSVAPGMTYTGAGNSSLAAVRLLPINSRQQQQQPSTVNPLDRHRTSDVLLIGSTTAGHNITNSNTTVQSRVSELGVESASTQHEVCAQILADLTDDDEEYSTSQEYIKAGLLHNIKTCLRAQDSPGLQLLALKIISCMALGPAHLTDAVVRAGCAPYLVPLVSSEHASVSEEAVWALGNMAGDSPEARELVLRAGIMPVLLKVIASERWAQTRDEVTAVFAQKLSGHDRYSASRKTRRSASYPTASAPKEMEVRQSAQGGTVMSLIVPSIDIPRTAGLNGRRTSKEDKC